MAKWLSNEVLNINLTKCKGVYLKESTPKKEWLNIKRSLLNVKNLEDLTNNKKTKAIVFVSDKLILVI